MAKTMALSLYKMKTVPIVVKTSKPQTTTHGTSESLKGKPPKVDGTKREAERGK